MTMSKTSRTAALANLSILLRESRRLAGISDRAKAAILDGTSRMVNYLKASNSSEMSILNI